MGEGRREEAAECAARPRSVCEKLMGALSVGVPRREADSAMPAGKAPEGVEADEEPAEGSPEKSSGGTAPGVLACGGSGGGARRGGARAPAAAGGGGGAGAPAPLGVAAAGATA